jgi:adenosylmethionine-8-amino-7-oxononanoate aminotransferase
MANPLACATAIASIQLLLSQPWQRTVERLHGELSAGLAAARELDNVAEVRTLGAIGVIELKEPVDMRIVQPMFVELGVWVRPFGKLVYAMPPYIMGSADVATLTAAMVDVVAQL